MGITVLKSDLLHDHIDGPLVLMNPEMAKTLLLEEDGQVELNGIRLKARLDTSVPASVVLVPRSMGVPIQSPIAARLKKV
jgi:hypothetical protein